MIITLLRKPLEGSVAENTLKHGCGALNIDGTRVSGEVPPVSFTRKVDYPQIQEKGKAGWSKQRGGLKGDVVDWKPNNSGRWPANFILNHLEGCEFIHRVGHADEDGKEEVAEGDCAEGCPVKTLDEQSGHLKCGEMGAKSYQMLGWMYGGGKEHPATYYGEEGGASRFFMQFKKENNEQ